MIMLYIRATVEQISKVFWLLYVAKVSVKNRWSNQRCSGNNWPKSYWRFPGKMSCAFFFQKCSQML